MTALISAIGVLCHETSMAEESRVYDVLVVGGGAAGLSATLMLARCRRSVMLVDDGRQRNQRATAIHGFLTREGTTPTDFYQLVHEELKRYSTITRTLATVERIEPSHPFVATFATGETVAARRVLLACGIEDQLPELPGAEECYGISVHHCPYCDGYESANKRIVVLAQGDALYDQALLLTQWSAHVTVASDGELGLSQEQRERLISKCISIAESPVMTLQHNEGRLQSVLLQDGTTVPADALFFSSPATERVTLAEQLGCSLNTDRGIETDDRRETCMEGVYAAGDVLRDDVQFMVLAAADGTAAAVRINRSLLAEDLSKDGCPLIKS